MNRLLPFALIATGLALPAVATAEPRIGEAAPAFTTLDTSGKPVSLADFRGKTVVLEWTNHECPFVKKHYGAKNMQAQQGSAAGDGVVWLTINSGAPGKQGHVDAAGAEAVMARDGFKSTAYLLDASGDTGRAYGAKTTPHMYIIDGEGVLRYNGAIDSIPSADPADIPAATQYVTQALGELAAGKAVSVVSTQPYGCSVKY